MDNKNTRTDFTNDQAISLIKKNFNYYTKKWDTHKNTPYFKGWNFAAMLFRVEWLVYRKMYVEGGICFALMVALVTLADLVSSTGTAFWAFTIAGQVALSLAMGAFGNVLYHKKILRMLNYSDTLNHFRRDEYLKNSGGVNITAASLCAAAEIFAMIL